MGLSNETAPNTATVDSYIATLDQIRSKNLADRLVQGQRNDSPRDSREAPNPNTGIHIRRIDLEKSLAMSRIPVTQEVADHNSRVSGIGSPERFEHLWKGRG